VRSLSDVDAVPEIEELRRVVAACGVTPATVDRFQRFVKEFYRRKGRRLPWRETNDPYRILVSEVMLQQTQVERVVEKYRSFLRRFPDVRSLAGARQSEVVAEWQGLGYNRRALMLREAARQVVSRGGFPRTPEHLRQLPGIGPACAGAVAAFAFGHPAVFIETNIRRVFIHIFFPEGSVVEDRLIMPLVERTLDRKDVRGWYYGLMDLGAFLKKKVPNPNRRSTHYSRQPVFEGSFRQVRSRVLRLLLKHPVLTAEEAACRLGTEASRVRRAFVSLETDGFVEADGSGWRLKDG